MSGIKSFLNDKVVPAIVGFTQMRYLQVIMNAFMSTAALTIGGSLFTLLISLPLGDWYTNWLASTGLDVILKIPVNITTNMMAVYMVFAVGYQVAKSFNRDGFSAGILSLAALFVLTPMPDLYAGTELGAMGLTDIIIHTSNLGAQGIFLALITGVLASRIYVFCMDKGWKIKMPDAVPGNVAKMFEDMIPGGLVFIIFIAIRVAFENTSYETAQSFIYTVLQTPLQRIGEGLPAIFAFTFFANFLWLFGVHGSMVAYVAMMPIMTPIGLENTAAFVAGKAVPHPEWLLTPWTTMGGGGSTLALCILMAVLAKSTHLKSLGRMAFVTSVFEINEPITFGIPIVLNPIMAVPFLVVPLVNLTLSLLVVKLGIIAAPTGASINSFMPFGVYGALVNAHWSGFVWSVVILLIDLAIYYPFFKVQDKRALMEEQKNIRAAEEKRAQTV